MSSVAIDVMSRADLTGLARRGVRKLAFGY